MNEYDKYKTLNYDKNLGSAFQAFYKLNDINTFYNKQSDWESFQNEINLGIVKDQFCEYYNDPDEPTKSHCYHH